MMTKGDFLRKAVVWAMLSGIVECNALGSVPTWNLKQPTDRNGTGCGWSNPMPLDKAHSLDSELAVQPLLASESLPLAGWIHDGLGRLAVEGDALVMVMPLDTGKRAVGSADDPDYAIYGSCGVRLPLNQRNLEQWNRLSFDIRTDLDAGVANMNVAVETNPSSGLGAHWVPVQGNDWQHVVYQIEELPRESVSALRFYTDLKGKNLSRLDSVRYEIRNLQLEQVAMPEQTCGWQVRQGKIAYSMSGYFPDGDKTAIVTGPGGVFSLIDEQTGRIVYEGRATAEPTTLDGQFAVLDFSSFQREGIYRLVFDTLRTEPFPISHRVMDGTVWKVLNFIRSQRCGDEVPGIHGKCHTDVFCDHDGRSISYGGGWHDAGDLSQQTLQTGDVAFALLEAYNSCRKERPHVAAQLLAEARHGIRQMVNTRFGDGWRASSIGLLHWTDGMAGTSDDIHTVRKQNLAMDNFLCAAYEAYAALTLEDDRLRQVAIEDFDFADSRFQRMGVDTFKIMMEHTYNTSRTAWMAAASWSASMLFQLTGEQKYAQKAIAYISYTLDCQEQEGDCAGFFYRDKTRQAIIHYIHQSREQLPVQALAALCETQPDHPDCERWRQALILYGSYLKKMAGYTRPYGMAPSGIYKKNEYEDEDGFSRLHLWAPQNARELYDLQLQEGVRVDENYYVRRFPIWFSIFNGNEAVLLSAGKAAVLCGKILHDDTLIDIGREQLYWTVGKNPFCQSLIYGEGHRYPSMDSFSSGEIVGEIPVGIRSLGNADIPYFPMTNNACYKEVWLTSAGKWLSLLAEMM